jgi:predicted  nucleic acid-binding Zn-ribbon protein
MDLLKLIQEGRIDDFKSRYAQKFGKGNVEKITKLIPLKYLEWVGKNLDVINFEENLSKLNEALTIFDKISTNLPITDLNQYKNVGELFNALSEYKNRQRREVKRVEGGNVVYEDDRFFVVNPLTHESSCYYGRGTKWCTAAESDTHFKRYNEDGKLFYILDKTLPTNDPFYKVALLKKFDGDKTYYDAKDESVKSGWIFNTDKLNTILDSVDNYLNTEYAAQIKIFSDKESAKKEKERLERLRIQRILSDRRDEAQERRLEGEWELGPDCPDEGLKAHALLDWLIDTSDVEAITNQDRAEITRIENEIERLQTEYDNDEEVRQDLLDEISDLEDELSELQDKIDVYNIIPTGSFYDTTEFEVIDSPDLDGRRYAVGTEDEMKSSSYEAVENLIDDIGYEGFNASFARNYLDDDKILEVAEEIYDNDVRESPESYLDEDDRMLSDDQEEQINQLKYKISQAEEMIANFENDMDGENDDELQEGIDELQEKIDEMNDEISDIESSPEGDFPEYLIEREVENRLDDVKYDIEAFLDNFGLEWKYYIDKDAFIEGVVEEDGYGHTLNHYDGTSDEVKIQDEWYYVMRID